MKLTNDPGYGISLYETLSQPDGGFRTGVDANSHGRMPGRTAPEFVPRTQLSVSENNISGPSLINVFAQAKEQL